MPPEAAAGIVSVIFPGFRLVPVAEANGACEEIVIEAQAASVSRAVCVNVTEVTETANVAENAAVVANVKRSVPDAS